VLGPQLALEAELTASYIVLLGAIFAVLKHTRVHREACDLVSLGKLISTMELAGARNVAAMQAWKGSLGDPKPPEREFEMRFESTIAATTDTVAEIGDFCCWSLGLAPGAQYRTISSFTLVYNSFHASARLINLT